MDKLLFRRILMIALSVLAVVYAAYLLISTNFKMYPTENAVQTTVTDKIYSNGFIIRDENMIQNNTSGVLSYTVHDGDEVKAGGEIAKSYANDDDAASQSKISALQEQLSDLQTLQKTSTAGNIGIDTINNNINNNIISQIRSINDGDLANIDNVTNNLLYSINQRQIYTGKATNFNDRISELQAEIATLEGKTGKSTGNITTEKSGCFLSHCDGYENALDYNNLDRLTLSDLDNVKQTKVSGNIAGKVVTGLKWYVACKVTADEATRLSLWDGSATVLFSDASSESIPATIKRIYQESKDSDALLILECDYMNSDLAQARQEPIEIGLGSYTGLRISKKAIHDDYVTKTTYDDNDNKHTEQVKVQGVYVLHGSEVRFKQISILYADDDYVICDPEPDSKDLVDGTTVELYDQVILEGDDLYDGKVSVIANTAKRLGLTIITAAENDATKFNPDIPKADRVICDVPCSGLGVIRRKPEIKYKPMKQLETLPDTQRKIINNAAEYVKPGGTLVYSTCTVSRTENDDIVDEFLKEHSDFVPVVVPLNIKGLEDGYKRTMLPCDVNGDGFFTATLRKVK